MRNMPLHGWNRSKRSVGIAVAVLACSLACGAIGRADDIYAGDMRANKILFLGNSLTYHPYNAGIGWLGDWGMDASTASNDYAHLVTQKIADCNHKNSPAIIATNIYLYGMFEQNYATYDVDSELGSLIDWGANIVVVELGDNASTSLADNAANQTAFASSFYDLLTAFKNSSEQPEIFVLSTWWTNSITDGILYQTCRDAGGTFVNISGLYGNTANRGGWGGHPNDAGMAAIADTLLSTMGVHAPEPNTLVMMGMAGLLLGVGWTRKHFNIRTRGRR